MKYADWLDTWITQKQDIKESTRSTYYTSIKTRIKPGLGNLEIEKISSKIVQSFINELAREGLSQNGIKGIMRIIKLSHKDYFKWNDLDNAPVLDISVPRNSISKTREIETFDKKEQLSLLKAIYSDLSPKTLGYAIALFAGLRIGEICGLKWKDIDIEQGFIHVHSTLSRISNFSDEESGTRIYQGSPKSEFSNRKVPITNTLMEIIKMVQPEEVGIEDYYVLTGSPTKFCEPRGYRAAFASFLRRNKIKERTFHSLRHTFATNWLRYGLDIKQLSMILGHVSIQVTLDLYTHPTNFDLKEEMKKFDDSWHK